MRDRIAKEAFADLRRWVEDPERYPNDAIGIPLELVPTILTPNRARLIAHLQRHGPADSVQELAQRLGRNYASVSRDVSYLSEDFLLVEQVGHCKRVWASNRPIVVTTAVAQHAIA